MPRSTRWKRIALLLILAPFAGELCLRGAARLVGQQRGMGFHAQFGWKPLPGVERRGAMWGRDAPARMNSRGWRDAERSLSKPHGAKRIVAVGDSYTFGVGVDDGHRFTDQLEEQLSGVEVLNLGVNGFGPDQELVVVEEEALLYAPDVVIVTTYFGNDLSDLCWMTQHQWPKPWYSLEDGQLVHHAPEASMWVRLRSSTYLGEAMYFAWTKLVSTPSRKHSGAQDPAALYLAIMGRMREVVETTGARLLVVLVHDGSMGRAGPALAERLSQRGFTTLDTDPVEQEAAARGVVIGNPLPLGHWNAEGHRRIASAIAEKLTELGWLD